MSPAVATGGMAATGHPLATEAALEILGAGGNAVDAALAAAAVTWVVLPMMCGPGGDAFALVFDPRDGEVIGVGAGGMAPLAATPDWFAERGHRLIPLLGPLSVGVPGAVGVMEELATRYGRLGFAEHFAAALRHADRGFPVSASLAGLFGSLLLVLQYFLVLPIFAWAARRQARREQPGWRRARGCP